MIKKFIATLFLSFMILLFLSNNIFSITKIVLPDPIIFQKNIMECLSFFKDNNENDNLIYPKQIAYDIVDKKIMGITIIYDESIGFSNIENSIDALYKKWSIESLKKEGVDVRVWKVVPSGFVIQLSKTKCAKEIQLIFMKFLPWSKN